MTPDLSLPHPRPEERGLQPDMHEQHASSYISIFDSYPLLRHHPRPIFESKAGTSALRPPSVTPFPNSSFSLSSTSAAPSTFAFSVLSACHFLRLATVSQLLDSQKRVCQYEIPGGGSCRDASCEDLHLSRIGTSTGQVIAEPSTQDTANYLSGALPDHWSTAYGSSFPTRIMTALEDARINHPTETFEERVLRVCETLRPHPLTS
ncbi:hypothetical protein F5878DRAFT_148210 [Lentinula raphanica]|uniref:Putative zinc-finger domain-containing protein n=1 Tax=Lentinula raphanica TaxID=153919 RepID=A0AA38P9R0_9AGAR|nr:hypothetical protein F5878DRAFT_148210 [Lentinula raphanica]